MLCCEPGPGLILLSFPPIAAGEWLPASRTLRRLIRLQRDPIIPEKKSGRGAVAREERPLSQSIDLEKSRVLHTRGARPQNSQQQQQQKNLEQPSPGTGVTVLSCYRGASQADHRGSGAVGPNTLDLGLLGEVGMMVSTGLPPEGPSFVSSESRKLMYPEAIRAASLAVRGQGGSRNGSPG